MTVPYSFATATAAIPLSQLDSNFNTTITLGNTAIQLGNTVTTLNNMTLANVTISSGNVTITNVTVTTANVTTLNATTVLATTANVTTANITTGNVTFANITGENVTTANVTTLTLTNNPTLSGGTANGVLYLNGSKAATSGSALTFDGTNFATTGKSFGASFGVGTNLYAGIGMSGGGDNAYWRAYAVHIWQNATDPNAATTGTELMRLTSTGLGIGTSSPNYKLQVSGASQSIGFSVNGTYAGPSILSTSTSTLVINPTGNLTTVGGNGAGYAATLSVRQASGQAAFSVEDSTASNSWLYVNSSGNVGIGTSSPTTKLHVQGGQVSDGGITYNHQLTSTAAYNASPMTGSFVSLQYNSGGSYAGMGGWAVGKENATDGNFSGYFSIFTRASGGSTTERIRIDSSGNLGLGVTPSAWVAYKALQVASLGGALSSSSSSDLEITTNAYYSGGWLSQGAGVAASRYRLLSGTHSWWTSTTNPGAAGNAISWTQALTLDASGNLGLGTTSPVSNGSTFATFSLNGSNGGAQHFMSGGSTIMQLYNDGNAFFLNASSGKSTIFQTSGTERVRIDSSGNLLVGTTSAGAGAILDVQSTTKGVRFPNMTTTQKNAITPAAGTVVFDTTLAKLCVYSGSAWQTITSV